MLETGAKQNRKENHAGCWREALNYKVYGIGKPYGPKGFDKILQNYSVSSIISFLWSVQFLIQVRPSPIHPMLISPMSLLLHFPMLKWFSHNENPGSGFNQ